LVIAAFCSVIQATSLLSLSPRRANFSACRKLTDAVSNELAIRRLVDASSSFFVAKSTALICA
jgi:hypothetical protein